MGDYRRSITHIRKALSLTVSEANYSAKTDKLYSRLAKCCLYLLDSSSAESAISSIDDGHLRTELYGSLQSMKSLWADIPDESVLRKQVLDRIPRYKSWLYVWLTLLKMTRLLTEIKPGYSGVLLCGP